MKSRQTRFVRHTAIVMLLITFSGFQVCFAASNETLKLSGGGLTASWDMQNGRMTGLQCKGTNGTVVDYFGSGTGGLEIYDELEGVFYTDRSTPSTVSDVKRIRAGAFEKVQFVKQFQGAPFSIRVTLISDVAGLHLESETVLTQLPDGRWPKQRNLRVSFVMPARDKLVGWAAAYPDPSPIQSKPVRYCYGIEEPDVPRTGIPMYTTYLPGEAGLSIAMPLDMPKVQLNLGPEPEDPSPLHVEYGFQRGNSAGVAFEYLSEPAEVKPGEVSVVRLTEKLVGLVADRPLKFGVWLFGHQPHWRPALGKLVDAYPEYFKINQRMRSIWGSRMGGNVDVENDELARNKKFAATCCWLHTHFHRHGEFIPPEGVLDPDYEFFCEPYAERYPDNSVAKNRKVIDRYIENGQAVFLYGFNMHCDTVTIAQRGLFADMARTQDGSISRSYHDQPVMFFHPNSPYGSHQLQQMDLMMEVYPGIMGIALDNWAYGGINFAHDDGITMFDNRLAANVNFSQQRMIGAIADKWHSSGRLVMVNKSRTIESMKGADALLSEARGSEIFAMFAYMCLDRHLHPNEYKAADDPEYAEHSLKYCLEWGGQFGRFMETADQEMSSKYLRLIHLLRNRTWVLDPDPLTLPEGMRGNIFRIHPDSPWNAGLVVVPVTRPGIRIIDNDFVRDSIVIVRLPEAAKISRASWLGVEKSDKPPVECSISRKGENHLEITLPVVGSAGVLMLEF